MAVVRLAKVAREINIGIETIAEHLSKKGFEVEAKPTTKLSEEMYAILINDFSSDIALKEKAEQVRIGRNKRESLKIGEGGVVIETDTSPKDKNLPPTVDAPTETVEKPVEAVDKVVAEVKFEEDTTPVLEVKEVASPIVDVPKQEETVVETPVEPVVEAETPVVVAPEAEISQPVAEAPPVVEPEFKMTETPATPIIDSFRTELDTSSSIVEKEIEVEEVVPTPKVEEVKVEKTEMKLDGPKVVGKVNLSEIDNKNKSKSRSKDKSKDKRNNKDRKPKEQNTPKNKPVPQSEKRSQDKKSLLLVKKM